MIIVLKSGASDTEVADVCQRITAMGYSPHTIRGTLRTVIGAVGDDREQGTAAEPRVARVRRVRHADPQALQARQPRGPRGVDRRSASAT